LSKLKNQITGGIKMKNFSLFFTIILMLVQLCGSADETFAVDNDTNNESPADDKASIASTDNNDGKLGVGFHNRFPVSGLSCKFWTPTGVGFQGILSRFGFSLPTENVSASLTTLGGRLLYTIKRETRTKFYIGGGGSYTDVSAEAEGDSESASGFGLEGVGGIEYTFSDLPNLGFSFEFGIGFLRLTPEDSDDNIDLHFTTSGTVGIHYYFNLAP
jgi:hypothetical protein